MLPMSWRVRDSVKGLSHREAIPAIYLLLFICPTKELVSIHWWKHVRVSRALKPCCLANDTLEIDLILHWLVVELAVTACHSLSPYVLAWIKAALPIDTFFYHPVAYFLFHVIDVLEDLLPALLASLIHEHQILNISLFPEFLLGQF